MNKKQRRATLWFVVCLLATGLVTSADDTGGAASSFIDSSGRLEYGKVFELRLGPGERLLELYVRQGQLLEGGHPLALLANEALTARVASVHRELMELDREEQTIELLHLKIRLAREAVTRLEAQIAEERRVQAEIPDYLVEGKLREWAEMKRQKKADLEVLEKELGHLTARDAERSALGVTLAKALTSLRALSDMLEVKAPFSGRVTTLEPVESRARAGDLVLRLATDRFLRVEALVWQHQLAQISVGNRAEVFPDFYRDITLQGSVSEIGEAVPSPREDGFPAFPVTIDLDGTAPQLLPGMRVAVRIFSNDAG